MGCRWLWMETTSTDAQGTSTKSAARNIYSLMICWWLFLKAYYTNSCAAGPGNTQSCDKENDYFAAFGGSGNVCGGVEFSKTAVVSSLECVSLLQSLVLLIFLKTIGFFFQPNGCGCKPSSHSPCIYNQDWGQKEEKCFVCTADDLSTGQCDTCKDCLAQCSNSNSFCISTSVTTQEFILCLSSITDPECRSNCHFNCMKN